MSKADQLGSSAAFGRAATARTSRRAAFESSIKGDAAATDAITELPVTLISENPDNPRNHLRNLDDTVQSVQEVGVILPIVVGTAEAYLRDRPDRADDLDDGAQYVVIDGHRRLEAARRVGLATIPVRVDNARLTSDEALLEAAFIANFHREDMTDLEQAHALQQLVDHYGSQTKACKRLSISTSTLSSKLSLLKLTPELQKDLMAGARKVEHVRNMGKLSPAAQKQKADQRAEAAQAKTKAKEPRGVAAVEPAPDSTDFHGVKSHGQVTDGSSIDPGPAEETVEPNGHTPQPETIPEPRTAPPQPPTLPYDDAPFLALHLQRKMEPPVFAQLASMVMKLLQEQHPDAYSALVQELAHQEQRQPA